MSSNAVTAQGTVISIHDGATPGVYLTIPEIKDFNGPGGSATVIDVTSLQSTGKEKRMGLQDEGQLSLTINYVPSNAVHQELRAVRAAQELRKFRIVFADAGTTQWDFEGFVTSMPVSGGVDAVVEGTVTIEITGSITES